jgi:hypothetical protein
MRDFVAAIMEYELRVSVSYEDRCFGFAMMMVVRRRRRRGIGLTHPIFSDPTEVPLIAANRCMPFGWAVAALSAEALTYCTRERNDPWTRSTLVKSG